MRLRGEEIKSLYEGQKDGQSSWGPDVGQWTWTSFPGCEGSSVLILLDGNKWAHVHKVWSQIKSYWRPTEKNGEKHSSVWERMAKDRWQKGRLDPAGKLSEAEWYSLGRDGNAIHKPQIQSFSLAAWWCWSPSGRNPPWERIWELTNLSFQLIPYSSRTWLVFRSNISFV